MKNKLTDLNNHLFAAIERLNEEGLTQEDIEREASRAKAIVGLSDQITKISGQQLKAVDLVARYGERHTANLPMLKGPEQ